MSAAPQKFWPDLDKKTGWPPFKLAGHLHELDSTNKGPLAPKNCLTLSHPSHSVVLLISIASGSLCTPFRALYAWAENCLAGLREFQNLYGTRRTAAIHVGMLSDCSKLGLGLLEISIAAGTGADVMAGGACAAGPAPYVLHLVILSYTCICL